MIVDAAREFVAIAVYNNVPGADVKLLERFKEPSWNNPVLRYLDADGKDLIPRQDGDWTLGGTLRRMSEALDKAGATLPEWLRLAVFEQTPKRREVAVFAMYCYWEGEKRLGALTGVLGTRIGSLRGAEVVEVTFDAAVLSLDALTRKALEMDCAHRVFARSDAALEVVKKITDKVERTDAAIDDGTQQQYHLAQAKKLYLLPMTALQATKVNSALASGQDPSRFLSPRQLELAKRLEKAPERRLADLKPARDVKGIAAYAAKVEKALAD